MTGRRWRVHADAAFQLDHLPVAPMVEPLIRPRSERGEGFAWERRFDAYAAAAPALFETSGLDDADVCVIPADWVWIRGTSWRSRTNRELERRAVDLYSRARAAGKPVVVFFSGDRSHEPLPLPEAVVFRECMYASRRGALDRALPAFVEDLVEYFCGGEIKLREYRPRPVVGFCGYVRNHGWSSVPRVVAYQAMMLARLRRLDVSPYKGESLRSRVMQDLDDDARVETNFVIRPDSAFWTQSPEERNASRLEYVDNLLDSDYVLCCRGSGNYSFRLYETLSIGRIPIFIDTDCVLPFDAQVPWRDHAVWIDEADVDRVADKVAEFHQRLSPQEFRDLQLGCRRLWEEWMSPLSFFRRLPQDVAVRT